MGSLGIGELILLAGIALIVIGPDKFPDFARIVGRTVRDLKGYVNDVKEDISEELRPVRDEVQKLTRERPQDFFDTLTGADGPRKDHGPQDRPSADPAADDADDAAARTDAECYDLHPGGTRPHTPTPATPPADNPPPADGPPPAEDDDARD